VKDSARPQRELWTGGTLGIGQSEATLVEAQGKSAPSSAAITLPTKAVAFELEFTNDSLDV
jgi:hypothetical protein